MLAEVSEQGPGDPLRWSDESVGLLMHDWYGQAPGAEQRPTQQLPEVLRAIIGYAHDQRGIRPERTAQALAEVDRVEAHYELLNQTAPEDQAAKLAELLREQGIELPADLIRAAAAGLDAVDLDLPDLTLEELADEVGGREQLDRLTDDPLPDEPFSWAQIPADIRPRVEQVLTGCDACADELLDVEHRTAMRRFLARVAAADPGLFRGNASPTRAAAAIALQICWANGTVDGWDETLTTEDLMDWFEVKGSVTQRADRMLRAIGVDPEAGVDGPLLGTPDLLVANRRADLIEQRDHYLPE